MREISDTYERTVYMLGCMHFVSVDIHAVNMIDDILRLSTDFRKYQISTVIHVFYYIRMFLFFFQTIHIHISVCYHWNILQTVIGLYRTSICILLV